MEVTNLDEEREEPTPRELTAQFIAKFRGLMGWPEVEPTSVREALGDLKIYRNAAPTGLFAITNDVAVRDALVACGGLRPIPYRNVPEAVEFHYDVTLPGFLWSFV